MNKTAKYIHILLLVLVSLAVVSCAKEEIESWQDEDYARIEGPSVWTLGTDSMEYSFASSPSSVQTFDIEAQIVLQGNRSDKDRTVYLKVDDASTTADASLYTMPESVIIPAGEGVGHFIVTLKREARLANKKYTLQISIDDDRSELKTGVKAYSKLTVKFSDILARPQNWNDLNEFFGASYSDVKYRFIIDTLGFGEFTYLQPGGMSWGEMWNYHLILIDALNQYAANHHGSPLVDESGRNVSFEN